MGRFIAALACMGLVVLLGGCEPAKDHEARQGHTPPEAGVQTPGRATPVTGPISIAVIPKGTTHVFWNSVKAGAEAAGAELGVEIIWKGPLTENDRSEQIKVVQQFVAQGVSGIVLAPLDQKALLGPVRSAMQKGIPVVVIDSGLWGHAGEDYISFVATDNREGGRLGGEKLAELIGGKGKVVLLRYATGHASTTQREEGFLEAVTKHEAIEIISKDQEAGATAGEAQRKALQMMNRLREADGIFCPNESSTLGMLQALRQERLAGKKVFVGFDASPPLIEALMNDEVDALVVQNPYRMGYLGVKQLVAHLKGEPVDQLVDTGVAVVTKDNINDPEILKMVLTPDVAKIEGIVVPPDMNVSPQ